MKDCLECGSNFQEKSTKQKFCNLSCSVKYNNKKRLKKVTYCLECGGGFSRRSSSQKFCSHSCAAKNTNRSRTVKKRIDCILCGQEILATGKKYCSQKCASDHRTSNTIEKWKSDPNSTNTKHGISKTIVLYLKQQAGWKCQSPNCCVPGGWSEVHPGTGTVPVEIDHIDGDAYNNHPDNLIVLCPNCHSLTMNYRALNKQGTRVHRK